MLPDATLRLLTAAVDGELSPADDAAFRRLTAESAAVREAYRQLLGQSYRLKGMRRVPAPAGLAGAVLARVPTVAPAPVRRPSPVSQWLPVAVAASTLLVISTAAMALLSLAGGAANSPQLVQHSAQQPQPSESAVPPPVPPSEGGPNGVSDVVPVPTPSRPDAFAGRGPTPRLEPAPEPRATAPDLIGAALLNSPPPLERVDVRLPFLAAAADLDRPDVQARLTDELGRDAAFRLDLFAADTHRGADAFLAAARQVGLTVGVDAVAHERMKRKLPSVWAVYTDALTADDMAGLAATLAVQDRAAEKPAFGAVHLIPAKDAERREIQTLLGAEPAGLRRAKFGPAVPAGKPVTSGTADQIAAALARSKAGDKPGVLLTLLPAGGRSNPQASREVREFLARRDDRKLGAVALLVVIRPAGS